MTQYMTKQSCFACALPSEVVCAPDLPYASAEIRFDQKSYCLCTLAPESGENTLIMDEFKPEPPTPQISDPLLFKICILFLIIGLISNVIAVWIWSSVKKKLFQDTEYLFKALTVTDLMFIVFFFPARLLSSYNFYLNLFFRVLCYGNRSVGIYIALMLAICRLVKLYRPLQASLLLSQFRLKLVIHLCMLCIFICQAFGSGLGVFLPKKYHLFVKPALLRGILLMAPAILQIVAMIMVLWKLCALSRRMNSVNWTSGPEQGLSLGQISTRKLDERAAKLPVVISPLRRERIESKPGARVNNVFPGRSPQMALKHNSMAFRKCDNMASIPVVTEISMKAPDLDELTAESKEAIHEREPKMTEQRFRVSEPQIIEETSFRHCPPAVKHGKSRRATIDCRKWHEQSERRVVYVVLALCVCNFIAYPFCSAVKVDFYQLHTDRTFQSYSCTAISLLNSSVNVVFYMFVNVFRRTFAAKRKLLAQKFITRVLLNQSSTSLDSGDESRIFTVKTATIKKRPVLCLTSNG